MSLTHADVLARIEALPGTAVLGAATGAEMWQVQLPSANGSSKRVLMTGGVHGDEPAGVEAVLQFLEGPAKDYDRHFQFFVIPCVNPSGLDAGTRVNGAGQDINRSMSNDGVVESVTLRQAIAGEQFDLFFDLHEDYEATGFYMYEVEKQDRLLGHRIVERIQQIGPLDSHENTDEGLDMPVAPGLFRINPKWRTQGWSAYAYYETNADHAVLTETPSTSWDLQRRVDAHLAALTLTLDHYANE